MNIFFNSRINANQSLLNVLFGQQQKAASSQNTGCRGTRDTLTISASGKEKLTKSTSGTRFRGCHAVAETVGNRFNEI